MNIYFKHDIRKASLDNIEQNQTFTYAIKENGTCVLRLQQSIKYDIWKKSPLKWNCAVDCIINTETKCEQIRQGTEWINNPF